MTDFDVVVAAPIEMVVRFPVLTGLDRGAPGHVETRLIAIAHIERTKPKLEGYQPLIREAAAETRTAQKPPARSFGLQRSTRLHKRHVDDRIFEALEDTREILGALGCIAV